MNLDKNNNQVTIKVFVRDVVYKVHNWETHKIQDKKDIVGFVNRKNNNFKIILTSIAVKVSIIMNISVFGGGLKTNIS